MSYYQQIQYVDYCKDGERFHNGGFVKAIKDGNHQKVELHITCKDEGIEGEYQIWMIPETEKNRSFSLGTISLQDGTGLYCCNREGGEEKEDVTMKIYLGQGRVLETLLRECLLPKEVKEEVEQVENEREKLVIDEHVEERKECNETKLEENNKGDVQEISQYTVSPDMVETEIHTMDEKQNTSGEVKVENREQEERKEKTGSIRIADTKWEQIEKTYPKKYTFEDDRSYIIFAPEDFLLLRQDYYGLINNSFLQHGYTNYHEMVLWKRENNTFYIGVPGIYDPRECQAAVYFGFERFECREEPPKQGELGYYLKRVYL